MEITGINKEKCTACGMCVKECPANLFSVNGTGKAGFEDPNKWCIGCGHCVAVCPNDAINYEASEEASQSHELNVSFNDVKNLLLTKRSARKYRDKDVPDEIVGEILEVMRNAPSGHNAQPCKYKIIKDKAALKMLSDVTIKSFKSFMMLIKIHKLLKPFVSEEFYKIISDRGTALGIDDMVKRYQSGENVIFFDAPAVIIVHVPDLGGLSYVDSTIAFTYGMLAAHSMGLGSCWIGFTMMAVAKNKSVLNYLNIPKGRIIAGVMTLGYSSSRYYRIPTRNKLEVEWFKQPCKLVHKI